MSEKIINQLNQFPSYKIDLNKQKILNQKSYKEVDLNEIFEISFILDSSYFNYSVDQELNFILEGKR